MRYHNIAMLQLHLYSTASPAYHMISKQNWAIWGWSVLSENLWILALSLTLTVTAADQWPWLDRWAWCLVVMEDPETSNNTSLSLVLWGDETHQSGGSVRSCEAGCCLAKFLSRDRLEFLLTISHSATLVSLLSLLLLLLLLLRPLLHPLHQAS